MAIAGVDTQGSAQLSALRNNQQPNRTDENRAQEAQDARFGTTDTSEADARQERFGDTASPLPGQGGNVPATSLDSQSLGTLIQATQEQDTGPGQTGTAQPGTAQAASQDEERQEEAAAPNSTSSLLPGATQQGGSADTRGVSLFV